MSIAQGIGAPPWNRPRTATHVDLAAYGHARVRHRLREWERTHRRRTILTDVGAGVVGVVAGVLSRESLVTDGWTDDATSAQDAVASVPWAIYLLLVVVWVASLAAHGAYATRYAGAGNEEYRAVFRAAGFLVALLACIVVLPPGAVLAAGRGGGGAGDARAEHRGPLGAASQVIAKQRAAGACARRRRSSWATSRAVRDMAEHIAQGPERVRYAGGRGLRQRPRRPGGGRAARRRHPGAGQPARHPRRRRALRCRGGRRREQPAR